MSFKKLTLYYQTLKHVKPTQLFHQVYYRLRNKVYKPTYNKIPKKVAVLDFAEGILYADSYLGNNKFSFLNLENQFGKIDWNYASFGKLWTYNLNYFEFLNQVNISKEQAIKLIKDFCFKKADIKDGLEPYPVSLRAINWIKFLAKNKIKDPEIDKSLYNDYMRLTDNLEYHLLANHLIENGFSLLFGAYYFKDEWLYKTAQEILQEQLEEQLLKDGAHYELSPMYHQIILHRILDSYNLVNNNSWKSHELLVLLKEKAGIMLGWLEEIRFNNGDIPKINDASKDIAPTSKALIEYAENLGIKASKIKLKASGYRKFKTKDFEVMMDVGEIVPTYQPGHSHADSLQFLLNFNRKPIIVDTGISTYEKNKRRQLERSTSSHNTVTVNDLNSSEVWGGFRVARRARSKILLDTSLEIEAQHNGFKNLDVTHRRKFLMDGENFVIEDRILKNQNRVCEAKGYLHFHPDVQTELSNNVLYIDNSLMLTVSGISKIEIEEYQFAESFNKLRLAIKITYSFSDNATLKFQPTTLKF